MGFVLTTPDGRIGDGPVDRVAEVAAGMPLCRHRGPDEPGTWHDDRVVFGFNRLATIDIEHSQQPLRWGPPDDPERYAMVFNGEIYNYLELRAGLTEEFGAEFRTEGDGESIVAGYHYYGPSWVSRLRGMFAFLIWDTREQVLFGARDPFGIKPLYTAELADGIGFASEAKSLRALLPHPDPAVSSADGTAPAVVDKTALQHYLVLQYVPEPESMDAQLRRVESGTSFTVAADGTMTTQRYFHPIFAPRPVTSEASKRALYQQIADVMDDSVGKHMRADVTVGSFLSGGIDSTAIAALAKRYNPNLLTFTTGFERQGYSEVDVAAESAAAIGVEHIVRLVSEEDLTSTLPLIVWYLDDPVADPALVPLYFVAKEARKHVKVVLSGEGADELFGGYNIYREPSSLRRITGLPGGLRKGLAAVGRVLPQGFRGKDLLRRGSLDLEQRYYGNARIFREEQLSGLLRSYSPDVSFADVTDQVYAQSTGVDPVSRMQHVDLFTWLRGDILVKADKMTMANALELRVPFLDKEVFEVARHIPESEKVTPKTTKLALRKAMELVVPPHVLNRRKLGFPVPIRHFLAGNSYEWARGIITSAQTEQYIDPAAVLALLDAHKAGTADYSRQIWTVLVFMLWHEIFVTGSVKPEVPHPIYPVRL
ncbi:asparagine synthase (glutamine-hydrolyzing) [Nakamurella sp. DB0629]|uniref:asparagine synthase (glutamine-hydrolyzing) n=2 Tax=Nakamurella aerolata TaxID=1656892 RepID=A0A849A6F6_9ACTN|nr:asparagine synthase (glutamine-hydrolyzing) [Nakamurella aerolata]NNG34678.1 asparagine synthase (glutamine-hydrolyzing) [Nakamurella aerolata]